MGGRGRPDGASSVEADRWLDHVGELLLILAYAVAVGAFAVWVDLFEAVENWFLTAFRLDRSDLDELLFFFAVMSLGVGVFAYRRWYELRAALVAQHRAEAERIDVERQLQQARRLEALGRVAGGVAHDFNNLLTVILGFSDVMLHELQPGSRLYEPALEVKRAGESAARLTRQLLQFSRTNAKAAGPLRVDQVLDAMHVMLGRLLGGDVHLQIQRDAQDVLVPIERGQLEQVILNLVMNAREAMPAGGHLHVRTTLADAPAEVHDWQLPPPPGRYVAMAVTDTGHGMDPQTIERAFEPFFTTKDVARGTGLGLATVYGIVRQSGGGIRLDSRRGSGTTVTVYLPVSSTAHAEDMAAPVVLAAQPRAIARLPEREHGTILLVEDDVAVRGLLQRALEQAGYRVLVAFDGLDGVEVAVRHPNRIDLVVSDLVMPRLNGAELASLVRRRRPDVRLVFMSGFRSNVLDDAPHLADVPIVTKPFEPSALLRVVRRELELANRATAPASGPAPRVVHASRG